MGLLEKEVALFSMLVGRKKRVWGKKSSSLGLVEKEHPPRLWEKGG